MAGPEINLDSVTSALQKTQLSPSGVSFAGKSLKLDSENDAKEVVEEINNCSDLQYLNLEGNTLGVEASKSIAEALGKHAEFKRALWKDMFTGRMKTEIPKALQFLGNGLVTAGARLVELDMSDNAFGPIGVEGLASLLRSSCCYALEELRLNNNGLGITGGKLLAAALTDCYNSSKTEGKPLALKVFIAGRNRLENDGAKALAQVFKMIGTLEEIAMPQNGIYHVGISALSDAFTYNKNLQILNLNDNTIGAKGAEAIAAVLPNLQNLKEINFGDCLLKTKGALFLAEALENSHTNLEELVLSFNEIRTEGGIELASAMANKSKLKKLILDGNQFGEKGKEEIEAKLKEIGKFHVLGRMDDNESEDSEAEEGEDDNEETESESESDHEEKEEEEYKADDSIELTAEVIVEDFLANSSAEFFLALGDNRVDIIINEVKGKESRLDDFMDVLMKVGGLSLSSNTEVANSAIKCSELLYKHIFTWAQKQDSLSLVSNAILVHLGLIKSENKQFKISWNLEGCFTALKNVVSQNFVPESIRDVLKVFLQREKSCSADVQNIKKDILLILK